MFAALLPNAPRNFLSYRVDQRVSMSESQQTPAQSPVTTHTRNSNLVIFINDNHFVLFLYKRGLTFGCWPLSHLPYRIINIVTYGRIRRWSSAHSPWQEVWCCLQGQPRKSDFPVVTPYGNCEICNDNKRKLKHHVVLFIVLGFLLLSML